MGKLRTSLLAGVSGLIALVGTTALAAPASAGVVGTYQFGQNGHFPLGGGRRLAQPNLFSDSFTSAGTTDSGSWQVKGGVVKIKITSSDQPLDVGCILKGTVTTAGIASPSSPGSVQCPTGVTGTWYAVENAGTESVAVTGTSAEAGPAQLVPRLIPGRRSATPCGPRSFPALDRTGAVGSHQIEAEGASSLAEATKKFGNSSSPRGRAGTRIVGTE